MSQITPFVKRMRTQGGTFYTFSSAVEDIGLNINERNNVVKMSHFAMLDLPAITAPDNLEQNTFNLLAISGSLDQYEKQNSIKDGTVLVAESFQNYALNLETNLLSQDDYNPALLRSVSERVFWKWLKETGAVRWTKDTSNNGYWIEPIDTDSSLGYNSVVKYVGEISAGSVRTDTYGTYNETYVLVPTSHGQTRVYFKQDYDDNYKAGMEIGPGPATILGRQNYTKPHPDGLSYQAFYDAAYDVSTSISGWTIEVSTGDGTGYNPGSWWSAQGQIISDDNYYFTDVSTLLDSSIYDYDIKFTGTGDFEFRRSNVDALEIEFSLNNLRNIFGDPELTFDKMAIEDSVDDSFDFNAILVYYTVYNQTLDKVLATNLLGILFLDRAAGNTQGFPSMEIEIPEITKLQSNGTGFGTSYSFRINIKSDNMFDDTQAVIYDESTSSQTALTSWTDVFASLEKSLSIMNSNSQYLQYITEQYIDISSTQTQQGNLLADLQYQVNDLIGDVKGTNNTIAMFQDGDDPLIDSSIYMDEGKIGIFNPEPSYGFQVDTSLSKFMNIMIQNAIVDTSQNIILGYGSPLQIGASTYQRGVNVYDGDASAAISVLNNKINVKSNSINFESSTFTVDTPNFTVDGSLTITGTTNIAGSVDIAGYIKDGSLSGPDFIWDSGFLFLNTKGIDGGIITDNSLGSQFFWLNGELAVTGGGSGASFLSQLLDVSIVGVPNDGSILSYNSALSYWMPTSIQTTLEGLSDTSLNGTSDGEFIVYDSGESKWLVRSGLEWDGTYLSVGDQTSQIFTSGNDMWVSKAGGDLLLGAQGNVSIQGSTDVSITGNNINIDGSLTLSVNNGDKVLNISQTTNKVTIGDLDEVGNGGQLIIDGINGKIDAVCLDGSDVDVSVSGYVSGKNLLGADATISNKLSVTDVSITNNLSVDGSVFLGNVPVGVPDTSQYVLFVHEGEQQLKRTVIWDASYLAFTDGVDNRIVTAGGPGSIQGEANLTFDGSILEFNNDTNKTIRMKADDVSNGLPMTIKGADAVGYSVSSSGNTTVLPFYTGGIVTPAGTGIFPGLPTTKNYGTYNGYGVLTGVTTVTTLFNFIPGYTYQTVYGTTTYTGYDGGDLRIEAGSGGDGSTGGGLGIVNIGGDGGDLILNAGEGGSGYSSPGLKGDVLMSGNDFLLDGDGTAQINGSAIVLNSDIVDVGERIRHRGDTDTYIEFTSDIIELTAGGVNMLRAAEGTEGGNLFNINPDGVDIDFYIKGDGGPNDNLVHVDAGNSRVGINKNNPTTTLDVNGSIKASGNVECATVTQAKTLSGTTTAASETPITAAEGEIWEIRGVETGGSLTGPGNYGSWTVLVFKEGGNNLLEAQIIDNGSSGSSVVRLSQTSTSIQIRIVPGTYTGSSSYRWTALRVN
jgi:hypothetical protein